MSFRKVYVIKHNDHGVLRQAPAKGPYYNLDTSISNGAWDSEQDALDALNASPEADSYFEDLVIVCEIWRV